MKVITLYIGLDVHKDSITIAVAEPGPKGELRLSGTITNDLGRLEVALNRIRKAHPGAQLEVAYEAGPCGFVIARRLKQLDISCLVAAPSLIPKAPGSPFKTDKRDARAIARLLRAGELTAVYIPEPTDEAIRDLCRARTDAVDDLRRSRHRLKGFLLRHGYRYQGKANWSQPHMRSRRQEGQPRTVRDLSWKAQNRLHLRFNRLLARRLQRNKAKVAIARELCGFLCALLRTQECYRQPAAAQPSK